MENYKLEIYSGRKNILNDLKDFNPSYDSSKHCIIVKNPEKYQIKKIRKYCYRHNINCCLINTNFERGSSYRRTFFSANKDIKGHYFCAYCGRYIPKNKITVDHIIPIYSVKYSPLKQKIVKSFGIDNINTEKNLAPACSKCNLKKGTKGGFWSLMGFVGKHQHFWFFRHTVNFVLMNIGFYYIYCYLFDNFQKCLY